MTYYNVVTRDGFLIHGGLWEFKPKLGYIILTGACKKRVGVDGPYESTDNPTKIMLRDVVSATLDFSGRLPKNVRSDLLERARQHGWSVLDDIVRGIDGGTDNASV